MPTPAQRATTLLLAHCTRRQRREWRAERAITVRAPSGRAYHISGRTRWNNIRYLGPGRVPPWPAHRDGGMKWHRMKIGPGGCLCMSLRGGPPLADVVLALKLVLETDDGYVLAGAPRAYPDSPVWLANAEQRRRKNRLPCLMPPLT